MGSSTELTDPRTRATRAALCTTYENWASKSQDEAFDIVLFFVDLVDTDEARRPSLVAELERLLDHAN